MQQSCRLYDFNLPAVHLVYTVQSVHMYYSQSTRSTNICIHCCQVVENSENSKWAAKNIFWQRNFGGRSDPNFDQKWQIRGCKTISNFIQGRKFFLGCEVGLFIKYSFLNTLKNTDLTTQNIFCIWQNFLSQIGWET